MVVISGWNLVLDFRALACSTVVVYGVPFLVLFIALNVGYALCSGRLSICVPSLDMAGRSTESTLENKLSRIYIFVRT